MIPTTRLLMLCLQFRHNDYHALCVFYHMVYSGTDHPNPPGFHGFGHDDGIDLLLLGKAKNFFPARPKQTSVAIKKPDSVLTLSRKRGRTSSIAIAYCSLDRMSSHFSQAKRSITYISAGMCRSWIQSMDCLLRPLLSIITSKFNIEILLSAG